MDKLAEAILKDAQVICQKINFKELLGKKILITGASGLVGNYFLATLKILATKNPGKIQTTAITHNELFPYQKYLLDYQGANILQGDLADYNFCKNLPSADYIIHAAGYGQPGRFLEDPVKTLKINTLATFALLEKLPPKGKFLFISTSEVYSGLTTPPHKEEEIGTTNLAHPRSCYIEAKKCGEAICNAYRAKGIAAKSARLCLAYGPGTKPNDQRVINSFIQKALQGKINLLDQGQAKRTYYYIADAVETLWKILLLGKEPVYNVSGETKITIKELAQKIGKYLDAPVILPKNTGHKITGAPEEVWLDTTMAQKEFGKIKYVSLDEGLKKTIKWQKELYKNN